MSTTPFEGLVFVSTDSIGRPATLAIAGDHLEARTRDGEVHLLALAGVRLEIGGESGHVVYCRPALDARGVTITCEAPAFPAALRSVGRGDLVAAVDAIVAKGTRDRRRGRIGAFAGLAVIGLLGLGLWWVPTHGLPAMAMALPLTVDRNLGDIAIEGMRGEFGPEVHTPATDAILREIVGRLSTQARPQGFVYRWRVVRRREVNAFALPGGQIVVFEGLLRRAARGDQVAGVLGHEISHVTFRHGLRAVARSAGVSIGVRVLLGDASALGDVMRSAGASAILNSYSRDQESEADAEGARMVAAAGLDPHGLAEFFDLLRSESASEMPGMLAWMSTHPGHNDRIAALARLLPTLPRGPARPLATAWAEVQAEIQALGPMPARE